MADIEKMSAFMFVPMSTVLCAVDSMSLKSHLLMYNSPMQ